MKETEHKCNFCKDTGTIYQQFPDCKHCELLEECAEANKEYCYIPTHCWECNTEKEYKES